jgi:hypothetical protein
MLGVKEEKRREGGKIRRKSVTGILVTGGNSLSLR